VEIVGPTIWIISRCMAWTWTTWNFNSAVFLVYGFRLLRWRDKLYCVCFINISLYGTAVLKMCISVLTTVFRTWSIILFFVIYFIWLCLNVRSTWNSVATREPCIIIRFYWDGVKVKVKCTVVQALRLCTGRATHRGSRVIALLYRHWGSVQTVRPIEGVVV
jgi:hypothetical protein